MTEQEKKEMLAAMAEDKGGKRKFWSLESKFEGTKTIRILPPLTKKGEKKFYFPHRVHWIDGQPYEALDQTIVDAEGNIIHEATVDPVQQYVKKLYRVAQKGSDEYKVAGALNAKQRYISRIIVRNSEDRSSELQPVFYEYGPTIYNMIYHIMTETDFGIIVDPKNGRDFNLTKVGTGRQSRYETSTPSATVSPIFSDAESLRTLFENAYKMDYVKLLEIPTAEQKQEALNEYLGIATKTQAVVNKSFDPEEDFSSDNEPDVEVEQEVSNESAASDEDDDIDSILNEFAG